MDKIIVAKKIDSILRCLNRIEKRLPETEVAFMKDYDAQDVVVLNLTRAIQMNVDIATHKKRGQTPFKSQKKKANIINIRHGRNICVNKKAFSLN